VELDKEALWQKIRDWPSASLAELALRIHNKLHIRREHAELRRAPSEHAKQIAQHDNPHDVGLASHQR
jgi:hypothetical protein